MRAGAALAAVLIGASGLVVAAAPAEAIAPSASCQAINNTTTVSTEAGTTTQEFSGLKTGERITVDISAFITGAQTTVAAVKIVNEGVTILNESGDLVSSDRFFLVNAVVAQDGSITVMASSTNQGFYVTVYCAGALDTTAPTANPTQSPAASQFGWNTTDVTVNWGWTDGGSGIDPARCTTSSTSVGEGAAITLTAECFDLDGNRGTATYEVKVDKTAPTFAVTTTPAAPNGNGWFNRSVKLTAVGSDTLSGIVSFCIIDTVFDFGGSWSLACSDEAGNRSETGASYKVDPFPPTATITPSRQPDTNGWYNAPVTFTTTGTDTSPAGFEDTTSGIASCTAAQTYTGPDTNSATVTGTCTDLADNVSNPATSDAFKYDDTDPTITVTGALAYTNNATVNITCTATDAGSGMASTDCGSLTGPASGFAIGENATTFTATDIAGNTVTRTVTFTVAAPVPPTLVVAAGGACVASNSGRINLQVVNPENRTIGAVAVTSSNTRLVPLSGIAVTGSGTNRTLTVTGVSGRTGTATLTVRLGTGPTTTITYIAGANRSQTLTGTDGTDLIFGNNAIDTINGRGGIDLLCGGNGDDRITGGPGADTINGGNGTDTLTDRETIDTVVNVP